MSHQSHHGVRYKDPEDVLDTGFDWDSEGFLTARATTISSSDWTVPDGLTEVSASNTTTKTLIRLSDGVADTSYTVTNHVVLANGEEYDRSILIKVRNR
jgi:hypothetical protein